VLRAAGPIVRMIQQSQPSYPSLNQGEVPT
jgi:hypothetical protein